MPLPRRARALFLASLLLLAATGSAAAQSSEDGASPAAAPGTCQADLSEPLLAEAPAETTGGRPAASAGGDATAATPAEKRVREIISQKGVHVVRFWAPWCDNSTGEMARGWDRLLAENEKVSFTFVTVWNNGNGGADTIERYGLPLERVTEVVPAAPKQGRLDAFMGYALDWVPSTWIFRTEEAGEPPARAFALNYGETERATLQILLDTAKADW